MGIASGKAFPLNNPFGGAARPPWAGTAGPPSEDVSHLNALLQTYGVRMPEQYAQPGIFGPIAQAQPQGWFGRHPGLTAGMDNALIAASLMEPTGPIAGAGENISAAFKGALGVGPYRRQFAMQQALIPLEFAQQVGGLQAQRAYIEKMIPAMAEWYSGRGQQARQRFEESLIKSELAAKPELGMHEGKPTVFHREYDDATGQIKMVPHPELDPRPLIEQRHTGRMGGGVQGYFLTQALANHYKGVENIPEVLDAGGHAALVGAMKEYGMNQPSILGMYPRNQLPPDVKAKWNQQLKDGAEYIKEALRGLPKNDAERANDIMKRVESLLIQNPNMPFTGPGSANEQATHEMEDRERRAKSLQDAYHRWHSHMLEDPKPMDFRDWLGLNQLQQQSPVPGMTPPSINFKPF